MPVTTTLSFGLSIPYDLKVCAGPARTLIWFVTSPAAPTVAGAGGVDVSAEVGVFSDPGGSAPGVALGASEPGVTGVPRTS